MNICCSGVKIILIDNILRTKLLGQLMTFLTVQLLFDKLRHTFLMRLFCRTYLTRNFFKHTVFSSRIGIGSYSIFNVKHCKKRKKQKDVLFINYRLAVNML
jgi:hypothetical protein